MGRRFSGTSQRNSTIIKLREARLTRKTDLENIAERFEIVSKQLIPSSRLDRFQ